MSLADDLLADGTVTQDPDNADRVIFNVPIYIKKDAVNIGGFEAFASYYQWTPTIKDADGNETPNPMSVYEKCQRAVWGFVADVFKAAIIQKAQQDAKAAAEAQISALI